MTRAIGQAGLDLIKKWEGCRLHAYKDAVGVWTIGWGHTGQVDGHPVGAGMSISQRKADALLLDDLTGYAAAVNSPAYVPFTKELNDNQRDALISFAYNCGIGSLRQLCKDRTMDKIPNHITAYVHGANGERLEGLVSRRKAEKELYLTPVYEKKVEGDGMEKRYNAIDEIPEWGQEAVQKLVDKKALSGDGAGLYLSLDMIRMIVILDRAGAFIS